MRTIPFAFPGVAGVRCAFQMRGPKRGHSLAGGNISLDVGDDPERVLQARRALARELGVSSWQELRQVHGDAMRFDETPGDITRAGHIEADGHATNRPGQALVVKTADCQPVLLAHADGGHVAALHVGWRGNRLGFPRSGAAAFCAHYGLDPAEVLAVRGPSLGPAASEFTNFEQEWGPDFRDWYDPVRGTVDLWRLTHDQLLAAGLRPGNIFTLDLCTRSLEAFFSYRRDRASGRQAALIWIE